MAAQDAQVQAWQAAASIPLACTITLQSNAAVAKGDSSELIHSTLKPPALSAILRSMACSWPPSMPPGSGLCMVAMPTVGGPAQIATARPTQNHAADCVRAQSIQLQLGSDLRASHACLATSGTHQRRCKLLLA